MRRAPPRLHHEVAGLGAEGTLGVAAALAGRGADADRGGPVGTNYCFERDAGTDTDDDG